MFYHNLESLCTEIKTTPTAFVKNILNMGSSNVTRWKNGTSPNTDVAIKIANYFNVTLDYLLLGEKSSSLRNSKEIVNKNNITEYFDKLSDKHKERILERIETYLEDYKIEEDNSINYLHNKKTFLISGQTVAGKLVSYPDSYTFSDINKVPENINADFALVVKGDSMEPEVKNGSMVYIKKTASVENATISIIELDGQVTCKKFYRFHDRIELISINQRYSPIIIKELDNIEIKIIGKVIL